MEIILEGQGTIKNSYFCLRLAHNSLTTGEVLKERSMSERSGCKLCGATIDSWRHALFYCTMSRCVWALVDEDLTEHIAANEIDNPKTWQETLPAKEFQKLLIICWAI
jgi:hypothetical protein